MGKINWAKKLGPHDRNVEPLWVGEEAELVLGVRVHILGGATHSRHDDHL